MALINCPECDTQVSSAAPSCPKCGYPVAQEAKGALGSDGPQKYESDARPKSSGTKRLLLVLSAGALVLLIADRCNRTSTGTTASPPQSVREIPREDSQAWCRNVVDGLVPTLQKVFGESTVALQVDLLSTMSCKGIPEGFSCVLKDGAPFELRVSDRDKVRGFRLMFTEEPIEGFAATGCCDGVAEAAERYRRAKFQRYGRDCSLTFGRFPP